MKLIYIHGIARQMPPRQLKFLWDKAIFGGESKDSALAYWSDINYPDIDVNSLLPPDWDEPQNEKELLRKYLPDVNTYLFDKDKRAEIQDRLITLLDMTKESVIVSHSLGTVIAFDVLSQYKKELVVPMWITLGSPLGIDKLQREIKLRLGWDQDKKLAKPHPVMRWRNFADPFDVVAADKSVADEYYGRNIKDKLLMNKDQQRTDIYGPHSGTGYLSTREVREAVFEGLCYFHPLLRPFYW